MCRHIWPCRLVARTLGFQPREAGSKPVRATIIIRLTISMNDSNKERVLLSLKERKDICWAMAKVFLLNEDAHGIHDMGVEIQALDRAIKEIESI
jgi:hypothetical protein